MEEINQKLNETHLADATEKTDTVKVKSPDNKTAITPVKELSKDIPTESDNSSEVDYVPEGEVHFPEQELAKLDEMINRPQWVVPVLAKGELEVLLEASIDLCSRGLDTKSELCQQFFRDGLSISFTKIYTNDAVSGWKPEIHKSIYNNTELLIKLCVLKLDQDWFPLLDLLTIIFNPHSKFHVFNSNKSPERPPITEGEEVFAASPTEHRTMKQGWLVDFLNLFGSLNGFKILYERFQRNLSISVVAALLRPFGYCAEYLTTHTIESYFLSIINTVTEYLEGLTDDELKKETKNEAKNDTLSSIINSIKCLVLKLPNNQHDKVKRLELFRLEVIFRLLKISSFNGKMNALNEINKLVTSVSYSINKHSSSLPDIASDGWLSPEKIAEWIGSKNVLSIVLRDSLHQPQYVEKLEKIIRFMIKEKALSLNDLDMIWEAQIGKHEAIVKNVHDLLAKLAWDFQPQQLDHLFGCFQASWSTASKKQREKLLALIRRLAEDDKEGIMAPKVLTLLWSLAKSQDVTADIMDQALAAHIKILDYSCSQASSQSRDNQKLTWVARFVEELKEERMVIPAIKQIREVCQLFTEAPHNFSQRPNQNSNYRNKVINYLHNYFRIVMLVSDSLATYMIKAREYARDHPNEDPYNIYPDGRFNHHQQVNERLKFLRFLLKDGQLWLCKPQANQIWTTLAQNAIYPIDRENCFRWFSKLMGDEPDLDPEITSEFFQQFILKLDPVYITQSGLVCFERFFHHVNCKEGKLSQKRRGGYVMEDLDLVGVEYLWRVVSYSSDEVAEKAIMLLKDTYTNLGNRLQARQVEIHEDFMQDCMNRLQAMHDTVAALRHVTTNNNASNLLTTSNLPPNTSSSTDFKKIVNDSIDDIKKSDFNAVLTSSSKSSIETSKEKSPSDIQSNQAATSDDQIVAPDNKPTTDDIGCDKSHEIIMQEANRMIRVLTVLKAYIAECDENYSEERVLVPFHRASRGKSILMSIRFIYQGRQGDDVEFWSHSNETFGCIRRQLASRFKGSNVRLELGLNNEIIDPYNDRKTLSQIGTVDKIHLTAKYVPTSLNNHSSPDSSSVSSTGSHHNFSEGPNIEAENCLPGVLLASKLSYTNFLFSLADLGCQLNSPFLRDSARDILRLMPLDLQSVEQLRLACSEHNNHFSIQNPISSVSQSLKSLFFTSSPSQVLYNLDLVHALLIPATNQNSDETWTFQYSFLLSGGVPLCLQIISDAAFLPEADSFTKKSAYLTCLRILKLLLPTVAYGYIHMVAEAMQSESPTFSIATSTHAHAVQLKKAFLNMPSQSESVVREMALKLGNFLTSKVTSILPDQATIKALQKIAWPFDKEQQQLACNNSNNNENTVANSPSNEQITRNVKNTNSNDSDYNDDAMTQKVSLQQMQQQQKLHLQQLQQEQTMQLSKECLEVLTLCLALSPSQSVEQLCRDKSWHLFIINLLIKAPNQEIRESAQEQFYLMATCCSTSQKLPLYFITLLFTQLSELSKECYNNQTHEYFQLLCRLLEFACNTPIQVKQVDTLLNQEINWLKKIRATALKTGSTGVDDSLIEGHLSITKELMMFQSSSKKYFIGTDNNGQSLIKELVEDFLFTSSRAMLQFEMSRGDVQHLERTAAICQSPASIQAAFNLLISLVQNCLPNLKSLLGMLSSLFHSTNESQLFEWEYMPPINAKPPNGFVGLKNAGTTCYMNSVLQQLFMIESIRQYILTAEGASTDDTSEDEDADDKAFNDGPYIDTSTNTNDNTSFALSHVVNGISKVATKAEERKDYNLKVLKYVQYIFAHLSCSKMQYYVPKRFWKHFRLQGEPVNLKEQHDALEFFNSLVDSLDEGLKSLGYTPILTKVLGGSFADQKICKTCPHRYSREEPFTVLNIDIRNQQNLLESLEQYVKGDLLEGANAYHCDKCNKKVDTVKRLCIKKLPPTLAIQLKRFDYDWERECAIKFNDYFEFPRQLDMMPYTVQGLAEAEGEYILDEDEEKRDGGSEQEVTTYSLVGVVVHSGQASGGHYFSYILHRGKDSEPHWYKFDDGDVSEFKMDDDDEMKNHCFGGDYMGEVFDHMLKRMQFRRQKRWWNAYILFYEKDIQQASIPLKSKSPPPPQTPLQSPSQPIQIVKNEEVNQDVRSPKKQNGSGTWEMPIQVELSVRRKNIKFLHDRCQYSIEYFRFMKQLLQCNTHHLQLQQNELTAESEEMAMCTVQLISKFLFNIALHTKKCLRGQAQDWFDCLLTYLKHSRKVRKWFVEHMLFKRSSTVAEYLFEAPSNEIRTAFMRMLVLLVHFSQSDPLCLSDVTTPNQLTLADQIICSLLNLIKKDTPEHNRHLGQYLHFFITYLGLGQNEKRHLINLNVAEVMMMVAQEDFGFSSIKYPGSELSKLYTIISQLVRSCDVSAKCISSFGLHEENVSENPYREPSLSTYVTKAQPLIIDNLFEKASFVKRMIQDCNNINNNDEVAKLLKFCCWENPTFSSTVLSELLCQVTYASSFELRPYLELLHQMLLIEDSWQNHRIHNTLKGITEGRDGLLETIQGSKGQNPKRSYQCIKMLVSLFKKCPQAENMLVTNNDLKQRWVNAVEWLQDEIERRPYPNNSQFGYGWSNAQTHSNETSNALYLERTNSAKMTLQEAIDLCPYEVEDLDELNSAADDAENNENNVSQDESQQFQNEPQQATNEESCEIPPQQDTSNQSQPVVSCQSSESVLHEHQQRPIKPNQLPSQSLSDQNLA